MHYLVTGGAGFIGRLLCTSLLARGDRVTVLDLAPVPPARAGERVPTRVVRGDVRDPAAVREALAGCDAVFHLAAAHHDFGIDRATYFGVNEGAAEVLCAAMDAVGVREVCFYSSVAVFGDAPEPHHEDAPKAPNNDYGASKLAGEAVFRRWAEAAPGRRVLVVRPTVTFGPGNFANMFSLIRQIDSGLFVQVGAGDNVKSLSYVENLVDATLFLWDRPAGAAFEAYNWVEKPDFTSGEIAAAISAALGRGAPRFRVPLGVAVALAAPFDLVIRLTGRNLPVSSARVRKLAADRTKFEADKVRAAGFRPRVALDEGIRRMVAWYLAEGRRQTPVRHLPPAAPVPFDAAAASRA
ncbi:UDP-N-acetylglucosamine 4-epimerase [Gemmatimonadetes bacterium T265]|nr:UDP-N-acetylglucosamine 4-epimerase [Gemmatimonadetes bacterium T265]